jgi:sugar phosphate isomerase/epimerase
MHDNFRFKDEHLAIGDGNFDFQTLFSMLRDINCVYTIEAHTVEDVRKSLKRFDEFMQAIRG